MRKSGSKKSGKPAGVAARLITAKELDASCRGWRQAEPVSLQHVGLASQDGSVPAKLCGGPRAGKGPNCSVVLLADDRLQIRSSVRPDYSWRGAMGGVPVLFIRGSDTCADDATVVFPSAEHLAIAIEGLRRLNLHLEELKAATGAIDFDFGVFGGYEAVFREYAEACLRCRDGHLGALNGGETARWGDARRTLARALGCQSGLLDFDMLLSGIAEMAKGSATGAVAMTERICALLVAMAKARGRGHGS